MPSPQDRIETGLGAGEIWTGFDVPAAPHPLLAIGCPGGPDQLQVGRGGSL